MRGSTVHVQHMTRKKATVSQVSDALARAHRFIESLEDVMLDEPEFASIRIAELYDKYGAQLSADRAENFPEGVPDA